MKRFLEWLFIVVVSLLGVGIAGVLVVYVLIGSDLSKQFEIGGVAVALTDDPEVIAEGGRQARLRGCNSGCHGDNSHGQVFFELFDGTRVVAPDLGRIVNEWDVADVERVVRHGVRRDGTSTLGIMPSSMLYGLSDEHLGAMLAYLRSQGPGAERLPERNLGPVARLMMLGFKRDFGTILSAEEVDHDASRLDPNHPDEKVRGRYLAETVCIECHGRDLRGLPSEDIPSLAIVAAYSEGDFRKLMREGVPIGDRELDLMAEVAVGRFAFFTDDELRDLYRYLRTLAEGA